MTLLQMLEIYNNWLADCDIWISFLFKKIIHRFSINCQIFCWIVAWSWWDVDYFFLHDQSQALSDLGLSWRISVCFWDFTLAFDILYFRVKVFIDLKFLMDCCLIMMRYWLLLPLPISSTFWPWNFMQAICIFFRFSF